MDGIFTRTLAFGALLLGGCTTLADGGGEPTLIGTQWRLIAFESSDDGAGTIRPGAEENYTLRLDPEGVFRMQLYCNHGAGRWHFAGGGGRGSLTLTDLATTRAACPPSPLEKVAEDMARVRSYVIEDGRLHLNLTADRGNYVWEAVG